MIVAALKRDGYVFCEAPNGKEALDLMRKEHPNVVVLDLMMPILSGWDVLQARELEPELKQIPVIVISANRAPEVATAVDKGICAFLPKPFDIGALSALVRSCLPLPGARSATAGRRRRRSSRPAEHDSPPCGFASSWEAIPTPRSCRRRVRRSMKWALRTR